MFCTEGTIYIPTIHTCNVYWTVTVLCIETHVPCMLIKYIPTYVVLSNSCCVDSIVTVHWDCGMLMKCILYLCYSNCCVESTVSCVLSLCHVDKVHV